MNAVASRYFEDVGAALTLVNQPAPRRALFLDRDGVINVDHAYVHTVERTEWLPGIFDLCETAAGQGLLLVVVTNQAGIARGLYSEADFIVYTRWMHEEFQRHGVSLLATYYCPHHPDAGLGPYLVRCDCRKPAPGMILEAAQRYGIILSESWLIGNSRSDIAAGVTAGVGQTVLLSAADEGGRMEPGSCHARTLEEARQIIDRGLSQ
jgi:D-glycero-D-manno-heptose 1,7-bisphosphate phosphatase